MISRFEVKNYKALRDVALDLTRLHVLIGPNDSGKTSVLEAVQILSRLVDSPSDRAFPNKAAEQICSFGDVANPVVFEARLGGGEVVTDDITYRVECLRKGDSWQVADGIVSGADQYPRIRSPKRDAASGMYRFLQDGQTAFKKIGAEADAGEALCHTIATSLRGIQSYRWIPRFLATPSALDPSRRLRMEESGFGLATLLASLKLARGDRFSRLEADFRAIFPDVKSISLEQEKAFETQPTGLTATPQREGFGIWIEFEGNPQPLSAASISDGFLLILAYLALQHTPEPPPVLLIEEPENGIHPKRLKEVIAMLRRLVEREGGPQIILTTHSPYLLDQFEPEEVSLCTKRGDGAVSVQRLSDNEVVHKQRGIFTLGEIWGGEGEDGLLGPKKVGKAAGE